MRVRQVFRRCGKRSCAIVFLFIFFWSFATTCGCSASYAQEDSKSCLWSVGNGTATVYLLGSLHFLKSDAYPLAPAIEKAYAASQKVVFETDIGAMADPEIQAKMLAMGVYPENDSLMQHIDRSTKSLLVKKLAQMGLSIENFARFKPWILAVTLSTLELQRLGFQPMYGVDMHFYLRAKKDGKELAHFEPIDYQLNLLGKMAPRQQNAFLHQTLKELEIVGDYAADLSRYWKTGDAQNLHALLFKSFKDHPQIYQRLLIQRNEAWIGKLESMLRGQKNVLVVVGAGHLVGPGGIVAILRENGYQVEQR
jgi:hypothetical protein